MLEWEGGEYRLALYPRGSDSSPEGYSSVYLDRLGGKSPCDVVFSIALLSAVDEEEVDKVTVGWCVFTLVSLKDPVQLTIPDCRRSTALAIAFPSALAKDLGNLWRRSTSASQRWSV